MNIYNIFKLRAVTLLLNNQLIHKVTDFVWLIIYST